MDRSTFVVAAGRPPRVPDAPLNTPIVPASSFIAGGALEYAREEAPTCQALEEVLGGLESGTAVAFASGMAAANAILDLIPPGARVVAAVQAYIGVSVRLRELAERGQIALQAVAMPDTSAIIEALPGAHTLWLESPTNPLLEVVDFPPVLAAAKAAGVRVVVDNTFATPILQRPLELGADIVMHSLTKAIAGHSDLLGGAAIAADPAIAEQLRSRRVLLGAMPSAFDCYLVLRGIRTLSLRVERAQATARILVDRLAGHSAVTRVRYPGFGTMAAIELASVEACDRLTDAVELWTHATSLGGVESLIERRRRWPLESPLVSESLMRLSFGIEHPDDLWADLAQALDRA